MIANILTPFLHTHDVPLLFCAAALLIDNYSAPTSLPTFTNLWEGAAQNPSLESKETCKSLGFHLTMADPLDLPLG